MNKYLAGIIAVILYGVMLYILVDCIRHGVVLGAFGLTMIVSFFIWATIENGRL